ncbi:uncharacterized protein CIMG_09779 [Coccidioides immitis RS]|uniref:Uncharacterized protein n=1 Tax=Coccidioides immitis (strain RS) TaxID=246410 RepID=J3K352_COCIM|nr:uncharacterized protein CIMG_09779 [Coccidioides immitis RS]EAS28575.3 hypothetical protein CIMG_09779 [Coccidioides immitis RS]
MQQDRGGAKRQGTRVAGGEGGRRLNANGNLPSQWRYMWLARMRVRGKKQFQTTHVQRSTGIIKQSAKMVEGKGGERRKKRISRKRPNGPAKNEEIECGPPYDSSRALNGDLASADKDMGMGTAICMHGEMHLGPVHVWICMHAWMNRRIKVKEKEQLQSFAVPWVFKRACKGEEGI